MFEIKKNRKKWAICGTGTGHELIPRITDRIIFALNDYLFTEKYGIKPDILCVMDVLDEKPQILAGVNNLQDVINRINKLKVPLIAPFKYAEIPLSQAFPIEAAVKRFGLPYFNNTISAMICFALLQKAEDIAIYGVNQASSSEFFYEKASVEYWLGIANGMGVKITINGEKSELLRNKARFGGSVMYGYNMTFNDYIKAKQKFGEPIVKKLLSPQRPVSKLVRNINA